MQAFDETVRRELPGAFSIAFGWCSFTYPHYVVQGFAVSGTWAIDYLALWTNPDQRRFVTCAALGYLFWITAGWPCLYVLAEVVASCCLRWSGWKGGIYVTVGLLVFIAAPAVLLNIALLALETAALTSDDALAAQIALIPCGVVVGIAVTAGRCPKWLCRRIRRKRVACVMKHGIRTVKEVHVGKVQQIAALEDSEEVP